MTFATIIFQDNIEKKAISEGDEINLEYPCKGNSYECFPYILKLPKGQYKFEAYGASGGTETRATTYRDSNKECIPQNLVSMYRENTKCEPNNSPGAGGYISGMIQLKKLLSIFYVYIGGKGEYKRVPSVDDTPASEEDQNRPKGGYNGGGYGTGYSKGSSGGGGSTDILSNK